MHNPEGAQHLRVTLDISAKAQVPVSQLFPIMLLYLYHHVYTLIIGCNICCQTYEIVLYVVAIINPGILDLGLN